MKLNLCSVPQPHDTFLESLDAQKLRRIPQTVRACLEYTLYPLLARFFGDEARYLTELEHLVKTCKQREKASSQSQSRRLALGSLYGFRIESPALVEKTRSHVFLGHWISCMTAALVFCLISCHRQHL
ncbi:hypothetical protein NXS19_004104 [Fusarium pseudograminearum]|nr:hypothetical protein NXS19_004104 [Fusarium pseudograminearum]